MKRRSVVLLLMLFSLLFWCQAGEMVAKAYGKATCRELSRGVWELKVEPGQGWPQIQFSNGLPPWSSGDFSLCIKVLEPATGPIPPISIEANGPKTAIKGRYVHNDLKAGQETRLVFRKEGTQTPRVIMVSVKSPTVPVRMEISKLDFGALPPPVATGKKRLAPLPPVMFKGKPFFPLGAYDTFKVGEGGKFGSIDPRFIEAGGNYTDFGQLYLLPEDTKHPAFKKVYATQGQGAIFPALEKIKNDPLFKDVAIVVGLSANLIMDDSQAAGTGMDNMFAPVTGDKLALHKKRLEEACRHLSKYPNVIGYTIDEPENIVWQYYDKHFSEEWKREKDPSLSRHMMQWIGWYSDVIKKAHPSALRMPILGWWTCYADCGPLYDVLEADHYPAKKPGMKEFDVPLYEISYDAALAVAAARKNGKTAIYMPTMFDIYRDLQGYTLNEELYAVFAPITRGVMGIHGWRLQRCTDKHRKFVVFPAMKEVSNLKEFFLGEWYDELVVSDHDTASVDYLKSFQERVRLVTGKEDAAQVAVAAQDAVPDVSYCLRKHPDGRYLLLAVNNMRTPVEVNFTLALPKPPRYMIDNINTSDKVWLKGNTAKVKFAPFGVHAYIFRP